ncbi:hypothetical protein AB0425_38305 [Actinosynnema sp. NPDC051121]
MKLHTTPPRLRALVAGGVALAVVLAGCSSPESVPAGTHVGAHAPLAGPTPPAPPLRDGERFVEHALAKPYQPSPPHGGTDDYRCLLLDPGVTDPVFLTGTRFRPQNERLVHHAVVYVIAPDAVEQARAKDAETPDDGWTCFGLTGIKGEKGATWVETWSPNSTETLLQQDVGFPVAPGSLLLLQIHYNLLAADGEPGATDQSGIRLRLKPGTAATKPLDTFAVIAPIELPCAPGESGPLCDRAASIADVANRFGPDVGIDEDRLVARCSDGVPKPGNTQSCTKEVRQAGTVYTALGHMHLLGRAIKVELNPGSASAKTLLDIPMFDFDNQGIQVLPTPVDVEPGDKLRITCTHDATLRKQLPQLRNLPPRYVVWGSGTSDEMCSGTFAFSPKG